MGVLAGATPRQEVLKGDLDDAIFAADFGDLIAGRAPDVYGKPDVFFRNTYPTQQLRKIASAVFGRLADPRESGATLRLSTGFGGGKTHTLMSLWHLAKNVNNPAIGADLLKAAGRPGAVAVAAIDGHKAGVPVFAEHGAVQTRSLWGELAWQIGGPAAWESLRDVDDPEKQPSATQFEAILPAGPVLFLLDELVVYMATLSDRGQGNLLAFLQKLMSICATRPQSVLVVSDPAGQAAYARQAQQIGEALDSQLVAAQQLDELFARRMSDYDPIGGEGARVIVRRLFERVDEGARQGASSSYYSLFTRVARDNPQALPQEATTTAYAEKIVECYPFHPRLVQTAQDRLGALQDFQKSRGTLRLFARIIRSTWEKREDLELISAGDLDWSDPRIENELLNRLNRDSFRAAVSADVNLHAGELDGEAQRGIHRRVASALLLESLPMNDSAGLDDQSLTLAVLRPEEAGPEPVEAIQRLSGVCWHTYPLPSGRGWQFRYDANVVKQIEERMDRVPREDARQRVLATAQSYFSGPTFTPVAWPQAPSQVSDSAKLTLVLAEAEERARDVCQHADSSVPGAPMPRRFINAIVAVAPTRRSLDNAVDRAQRLLAAELVKKDYARGAEHEASRKQMERLLPEYQRQQRIQACRAFDVVVTHDNRATMPEKYLVGSDSPLENVQGRGQASVLQFLKANDWIYLDNEALDADRFVDRILPGATPTPDATDVWTAKALHERALSAPDLRLLPGPAIVSRTIRGAVEAGRLVVRLANGDVWSADGSVVGPPNRRHAGAGNLPVAIPLTDDTLVTRADSAAAAGWLAISPEPGHEPDGDADGYGIAPPPPPSGDMERTAHGWPQAIEHAAERPLKRLRLTAHTPAAAQQLASLAQPFGAERLSLSVSVTGDLSNGGSAGFSVAEVRPSHPARPLDIARTLYQAMSADGRSYEATLELTFDAGRVDTAHLLERASADADGVGIEALFGLVAGERS